jgi:hypothetical protein
MHNRDGFSDITCKFSSCDSYCVLAFHFPSILLRDAEEMKELVRTKGGDDRLKHKILATCFYEPSTRTSCSFQAAILRLGGNFVAFNEATSSAVKGETIKDTVQTLASYCDAIVIRHPVKGTADLAASVSSKPVINAGALVIESGVTSSSRDCVRRTLLPPGSELWTPCELSTSTSACTPVRALLRRLSWAI